jgi:pimeloyl-ACP methyl ester carboxylesterase
MTRSSKTQRLEERRCAADLDWVFHASDDAVLDALARGRHLRGLRQYFGAAACGELATLAAAAKSRRIAGGPRALIVPGMMGSRLGEDTRALWIDPGHIAEGGLRDLTLPSKRSIRPMGTLLFAYARLKLTLDIEGFETEFFPYDWRRGIDESGEALAAHIAAGGKPVVLIAHSMGGMVARVAVKTLPERSVRRLIMLGTPNRGSFAAVQALRGTYPFVRKLAQLDRRHSPEVLAARVLCTFPGLYDMLPTARGTFEWPRSGPRPRSGLMRRSMARRARLAPPDERMVQIIGISRETPVSVRAGTRGFDYRSSLNGDGTVPVALALLRGLPAYFVDELHGNLANNPKVIRAVVDLARRGSTKRLARHFVAHRGRHSRTDDARLRSVPSVKIDWRHLNAAQREAALSDLDSANPPTPGVAAMA